MSSPPREIGTLIVVVLKANHLPNKRHIGKQDPYCLVIVNGEKKRTKAIKRGGQHPEWDEELRFTLLEDDDDLVGKSISSTPPQPPPKDQKGPVRIQGGNSMKIACYADDPREPDLIGDAEVDLTEVLTKGETDEWFTLSNKDKFAGKVYLELTFWSNAPAPEKKVTPKPPKNHKQYAGPGSFVPSNESPSRMGQTSNTYGHSRPPSDSVSAVVPSSLRASSSLAKLDLYIPPYEKSRSSAVDQIVSEFSEMGMTHHRKSLPPVQQSYSGSPSNPYLGDSYYEANQHSVPSRTSRFSSVPVSSSGFMPLNGSPSYSPAPRTTDPHVYPADFSQMPTPAPYNSMMYQPPANYLPPPPQTPIPGPPNSIPFVPATTSHYPPSFSAPPNNQYPSVAPPTPAPPQQYSPVPQGQPLIQNNVAAYQHYQTTSSSPHDSLPTPPAPSVSRPLPPQPQIVYSAPPVQDGIPPPPPPPPVLPTPPPPPPIHYNEGPPPPPPTTRPHINSAAPMPPATPAHQNPRRRASLPVPPVIYPQHQQLPFQPPPPPPPLPGSVIEGFSPALPPPPPQQLRPEHQTFSPGPPPQPPAQFHNHDQWQLGGVGQDHHSIQHVPNHI